MIWGDAKCTLRDRNNSVSKPNVEYAVRGPDADGRGEWGDGFTVKAGSKARREVTPSASKSILKNQERLLEEGVLVHKGSSLEFLEDYTFGLTISRSKINSWT